MMTLTNAIQDIVEYKYIDMSKNEIKLAEDWTAQSRNLITGWVMNHKKASKNKKSFGIVKK